MSTIGRPRSFASFQANHMTTAPTATSLAMNSGSADTDLLVRDGAAARTELAHDVARDADREDDEGEDVVPVAAEPAH